MSVIDRSAAASKRWTKRSGSQARRAQGVAAIVAIGALLPAMPAAAVPVSATAHDGVRLQPSVLADTAPRVRFELSGTVTGRDFDMLGVSVDLSADGARAVAGANFADDWRGAAFVLAQGPDGSWRKEAKLKPPAGFDDFFGYGVAISGDGETAAVGGSAFDRDGNVAIYSAQDGSWVRVAALRPPAGSLDELGMALSLNGDGDVLVVGAPGHDDGAGAAIVYERSPDDEWTEVTRLTPDGSYGLGMAVAISDDGSTMVAGAPTRSGAYVFARDADGWTLRTSVVLGETLGYDVALTADGDLVAMGDPAFDSGRGSVRVYEREGEGWVLREVVPRPAGQDDSQYGVSVDLAAAGDVMVVGAADATVKGEWGIGSAFVYHDRKGRWKAVDVLQAKGGERNDAFGYALAVDDVGSRVAVGAYGFGEDDPGRLSVYDRRATS